MLKKTIQIVFLLLKSITLLYIISFIVLIFYLKTGIFDERKVNTEYVGKIATEPPLADIYPRGHIPGVYFVMGEKLKYHLENELVDIDPWWMDEKAMKKKNIPYKIRWEDNFTIENDGIYYICIGCKIKSLTYSYRSKYCDSDWSDSAGYAIENTSLIPADNVVLIYKGDVRLNPILTGNCF